MAFKKEQNRNFNPIKKSTLNITPKRLNYNNLPPPPPPPPPTSNANSPISRISKLFTTRQKWPIVVAFFSAFALGAVGLGIVGLIVGIVLGLFLLTKLAGYRFHYRPWQTAVNNLLPIVAKAFFFSVFLLPIADYLTMPSGHSPDSLVKYISIMIAIPQNFVSGSPNDVFPGIPIIVLLSIILMVWGGLNLTKKKSFMIALSGLLLYTFSPTIASITVGNPGLRFVVEFYAIGFYLAWIGLALTVVSQFLPKYLKPPQGIPQQNVGFSALAPLIAAPFFVGYLLPALSQVLVAVTPVQLDFESAHHTAASLIAALLAALGAGSIVSQEDDDQGSLTVSLTYPAGRSPNVFTSGWLFGARAILNAGKPDEEDVSHLVKWSGTGMFEPAEGQRSRPTFNSEGSNTITLTVEAKGRADSRNFHVNAISPSGFAAQGDKAKCPADAHGCPACPHPTIGPITTGSPTVLVNGRPAARKGDVGIHAACCGPNSFTVVGVNHGVLIDGRPAAKKGDPTQHCGGSGNIVEGAA